MRTPQPTQLIIGLSELKAILGYIVSLRLASAIQDRIFKKNNEIAVSSFSVV